MTQTGHLVFVVDDQSVVAETLAKILVHKGFRAVAFDDPGIALSAVSINHPDILISDVIMPRMTGIDLAIHVWKVHPKCRVLLISGQIETTDLLEHAKENGYDFDILPKPIHPEAVLGRLHDLINRADS
jgi:DNA-binding NtrC family response regulator